MKDSVSPTGYTGRGDSATGEGVPGVTEGDVNSGNSAAGPT